MQMRDKGGKEANFLTKSDFLKMYLNGETETLFDRYERHDVMVGKDRLIYAHHGLDEHDDNLGATAVDPTEYVDAGYSHHESDHERTIRKAIGAFCAPLSPTSSSYLTECQCMAEGVLSPAHMLRISNPACANEASLGDLRLIASNAASPRPPSLTIPLSLVPFAALTEAEDREIAEAEAARAAAKKKATHRASYYDSESDEDGDELSDIPEEGTGAEGSGRKNSGGDDGDGSSNRTQASDTPGVAEGEMPITPVVPSFLMSQPQQTADKLDVHAAARMGNLTIIKSVFAFRGVELLDDRDTKAVRSVTHYAALKGQTAIVKYVIEHGCDIDILDSYKHTPLHLAALEGHTKVCEMLISAGCNTKVVDNQDRTPMHWAAFGGHVETVHALAKAKLDTDPRDNRKKTPLLLAAEAGHPRVIQFLNQSRDADIHARDSFGRTALHYTCALHGNHGKACLDMLLREGLHVNALDSHNKTPLHMAVEADNVDTVKSLLKAGANRSLSDMKGNTAEELAQLEEVRAVFRMAEFAQSSSQPGSPH